MVFMTRVPEPASNLDVVLETDVLLVDSGPGDWLLRLLRPVPAHRFRIRLQKR